MISVTPNVTHWSGECRQLICLSLPRPTHTIAMAGDGTRDCGNCALCQNTMTATEEPLCALNIVHVSRRHQPLTMAASAACTHKLGGLTAGTIAKLGDQTASRVVCTAAGPLCEVWMAALPPSSQDVWRHCRFVLSATSGAPDVAPVRSSIS